VQTLEPLGRGLILLGLAIVVIGGLILLAGRLNLPFVGHLPGDILWRRGNFTVYFPLVSCLVASLVLTVLLNLVVWLFRR
jgi:ABC-type uncharacterized transport system permease subunit